MKRNANIVTLSKEHHHVLLFAWKIRQGIKSGTEIGRMRKYVRYFWENDLQAHFQKERTVLFSTLDSPVVRECLDRQSQVNAYVQIILGNETDQSCLPMLAELIEKLVRYEERTVFPYFEQHLTQDQLLAIGKILEKSFAAKDDDGYLDQFWSVAIPCAQP